MRRCEWRDVNGATKTMPPKKGTKYKQWPRLEKRGRSYYAYYIDANGRKQQKSLKERNELRAQAKFTKLLEDVDRGVLGFSRTPQALPFDEMVDRYLAEGTADLSPQSIRRHKQVFKNQLKPHFKKASVKSIGPREIVKYIRMRQEQGAAPNTIHKEIAGLSAVFNFLAAEELIPPMNPTRSIKKPRLKQVRPHYAPSGPELEKIFEHLYPGARLMFLAFCNTGCRLAEIRNTNVSDADFEQKLLRVVRKGGKVDYVPLNAHLLEAIREDLKNRSAKPDYPLFLNNHGQRYMRITRSLRTACRNAGVPHTTHHGLRHAYATLLHEAGQDDGTISKLLGHANPTITRNIYIHWKDPEVRRAAESVAVGKSQKSRKALNVLKLASNKGL